MAANFQNVAKLMQFVKQHPGLSVLATSTVAGPLLGFWTHSGAPISGYGRLLTQAGAHSVPAEFAPSPNIPPVSVFGHPDTIFYSAAALHLLLKPRTRSNVSGTPTLGKFSQRFHNTSAIIGRFPADAAHIFSLASGLALLIGTTAIVALCNNAINSWSHKKKFVSDAELIVFLQIALQKAKGQNEATLDHLSNTQRKLRGVWNDLSAAQAELTTMKTRTGCTDKELSNTRTQLLDARIELEHKEVAHQNSVSENQEKLPSVQGELALAKDQLGSTEKEMKSTHDYLTNVQAEMKQKEAREQEMTELLCIAYQEASDLKTRAAKGKLKNDFLVLKPRDSNTLLPEKAKRIAYSRERPKNQISGLQPLNEPFCWKTRPSKKPGKRSSDLIKSTS
jgi:hypothetical protein